MQSTLFSFNQGMARITLPGRPITKKNNPLVIHRKGGKGHIVLPSKEYRDYEKLCLTQLLGYKGPKFRGPIHVKALYWMPDNRSKPDLANLFQATADILEVAGIVENDRLIVNWDGSRIVGIDKYNPRAELTITEVV